MVIKFLKNCTDATGKAHKKGDVTNVAKCIARGLLGSGMAEVFRISPPPPEPSETGSTLKRVNRAGTTTHN